VFAVRQKTLTERSVREKKGKFHARHFLRAPLQTTTQQPMGNKAGSAEKKNQTVKRKEEKRRRFIDAHYWESCWHLVHDFTKKKEENERARSLSAHGRPFKSI
jgi:tetrahydromethanopterin S-methyltransferase subunit H